MDRMLQDIMSPEFLTWYLCLSVYSSIALLYDDFNDKPVMSKKDVVQRILMGFTPGYNVIVPFFWTIFKVLEVLYHFFGNSDKSEEQILEERQDHVFAFLKYRGIELSELDEYIESRNLMGKMIDKVK